MFDSTSRDGSKAGHKPLNLENLGTKAVGHVEACVTQTRGQAGRSDPFAHEIGELQ